MERKIDRFDKFMKAMNLNDNRVTEDLHLSVGTIGKSRKEGRDLSSRVVEQILKFYTELSRTWLVAGVGEMLVSQDIHHVTQNINGNNNANNLTSDPATMDVILRLTKMLEAERAEVERLKAELAELKK